VLAPHMLVTKWIRGECLLLKLSLQSEQEMGACSSHFLYKLLWGKCCRCVGKKVDLIVGHLRIFFYPSTCLVCVNLMPGRKQGFDVGVCTQGLSEQQKPLEIR